jgi:adenylate cyclase
MTERRQKREIRQLFGQYVPEDYVNELLESPEHHSMEGQTRTMTVLFSDIRNFTTISENLDATEVKNLLNSFFTPITEIIFNNKGTIDKYVGDMVISFWGAPMEDKEHAYHAVSTSLTMIEHLPIINAELLEKGLPSLQIGVGLATGPMNVGDMGSKFRRAYTVLGDTVNLGSRLQDLTKFYKVPILTNDITHAGQNNFVWRPIDKVAVKGRAGALTIYQPLGMVASVTTEVETELQRYLMALNFYYQQNWKEAETSFKSLLVSAPSTYLYQLYLDRITQFKKTPPPEHWDGVFIHSHK